MSYTELYGFDSFISFYSDGHVLTTVANRLLLNVASSFIFLCFFLVFLACCMFYMFIIL